MPCISSTHIVVGAILPRTCQCSATLALRFCADILSISGYVHVCAIYFPTALRVCHASLHTIGPSFVVGQTDFFWQLQIYAMPTLHTHASQNGPWLYSVGTPLQASCCPFFPEPDMHVAFPDAFLHRSVISKDASYTSVQPRPQSYIR